MKSNRHRLSINVKWRKTLIAWSVLGALLLGATAAIYFWGFKEYYYPPPPTAHYARPGSLADAQRDDLDYLRKLLHSDWSYTPATRTAANVVIDAALAGPLPLPSGKFELVVSRVLAIADNGHTNIAAGGRANRLKRLPMRFYLFTDGVFIVRALPAAAALLGKRIVDIDGHAIAEVRATMNRYTGGSEEERDSRLPFALEAPELLHAAGVANSDDSVTLGVSNPDGTKSEVKVSALPPNAKEVKTWPSDEIQPSPVRGENGNWQAALRGKSSTMLLFAEPVHAFVMRQLPAQHAYYLRFNTNISTETESIGGFVEKAETTLLAAKPRVIVIDMRFNGGGDYTSTAAFMRNLPLELPGTRFFVLEGPDTFSAGMTSLAFLKQAGGARTILVGSRPGDRMRFHSEGSSFCLPWSKICMFARTALHDYSTTNCRPVSECFVLDWFYPVAIRTFEPDIHAPLTWKALSVGHDPALETVFPNQGY